MTVLDIADDWYNMNLENAEHYGLDSQLGQLQEECAELIQAVNKYRRANGKGQPTNISIEQAEDLLFEETIDVSIMIEQIAHLMGWGATGANDLYCKKIERTKNRMEKENEAQDNSKGNPPESV